MRSRAPVVAVMVIVATLGAAGAAFGERRAEPRCERVLDATIPEGTKIASWVDFEVGRTNLRKGDHLAITEVLGTRSRFEKGEFYIVRGEYTLASSDEVILTASVTASRQGEGCTMGNPRARVKVKRGSGTFELAFPILFDGHPHVWFDESGRNEGGHESPGVYFGRDAFLRK